MIRKFTPAFFPHTGAHNTFRFSYFVRKKMFFPVFFYHVFRNKTSWKKHESEGNSSRNYHSRNFEFLDYVTWHINSLL